MMALADELPIRSGDPRKKARRRRQVISGVDVDGRFDCAEGQSRVPSGDLHGELTWPDIDDAGAGARRLEASDSGDLVATRLRFERAVLAFVALGVLLRVARYLTNYPVW